MTIILLLFSAIIISYLAFGVGYQLFYAIAGKFYRAELPATNPPDYRIGVFIPAYREDGVILATATEALRQDYPRDRYEVTIIADSLQPETLAALRALPLRVVEVSFARSTKSKALNRTLSLLGDTGYDLVVLLDADNLMSAGFLRRVAGHYHRGVRVLQGQRAPQNLDTPMAILDGASEAVNNHILCKGHRRVGLSARLAGSGMAFDYQLFRTVMPEVDAVGGFDKELELLLTQRGESIAYDEAAIVYDEKVRRERDFSRQRSRWIAAQFHYAKRFFPRALADWWRTRNSDFLNKATQMLLPPRLLTPGILWLGALIHVVFGAYPLAIVWLLVALANLLSFALAMPAFIWRNPHRRALLNLPLVFIHALLSLSRLGHAQRNFINTPHGQKK